MSNAIEIFRTLVVFMVMFPLPRGAAEIEIGAVSSKFWVVSCGLILFLVSLILFEAIEFP